MILAVFLSDQSHSQGRSHLGRPSSPSLCRFSTILTIALNIGLMHSASFIFILFWWWPPVWCVLYVWAETYIVNTLAIVLGEYKEVWMQWFEGFSMHHMSPEIFPHSACLSAYEMVWCHRCAIQRVSGYQNRPWYLWGWSLPWFTIKSRVCTYEFLKAIWSGATVTVNAKLIGLLTMMFSSVEVLSWNRLIFYSTRWSVEFFGYATEAFMVAFFLQ